ncbi:MAG: hypothetical protein KF794_05225 [Xanthobacteraceae bacterium]|nr:hypothetical protein [Xanthobacteraceae bacterium]QYK46094.1 MAG: hypothetical protein KF794_05225 [Xanthobacteraceae bacterium]
MRRRERGWHDHSWPEERNFLARAIAPANRMFRGRLGRVVRWLAVGVAAVVLCVVGLYIALLSGLVSADIATPWIASALEEKLPPGYRVEIGKTKLDYDSTGAPVLAVEAIVIKNEKGEEVVRAPMAEVGLEPGSLIRGNYRARRITLIGAKLTVRLDENGNIRMIAPQTAQLAAPVTPRSQQRQQAVPAQKNEPFRFQRLAAWLDSFEKTGLDGIALSEVALERGTLVVVSETPGRSWQFNNIRTALRRPGDGGLTFTLSSGDGAQPWELTATIGAAVNGERVVDVNADRVVPNDLLYAAGYGDSDIFASTPVTGLFRARIATDGRLVSGSMVVVASKGQIGTAADERGRFDLDEVRFQVRFAPDRGAFVVDPIQIVGGQNRILLGILVNAPADGGTNWTVTVPQGLVQLTTGRVREAPLTLDRIMLRGGFDTETKVLSINEGLLQSTTATVALTGGIDFAPDDPILKLGIVGNRMPLSALKRLWPAPVAPGTRNWVLDNIESGTIERLALALNIPLETLGQHDVPLNDDAVNLEIDVTGAKFTPVQGLPPIVDAKGSVLLTGRTARIRVNQGTVELSKKRKLTIPDGLLEFKDHTPKNPVGTITMRLDGGADAIAELLAKDILKGEAGVALDPDTTRGTVSANLRFQLPFKRDVTMREIAYAAEANVTNFAAENLIRGQKMEAANARVTINAAQIVIKGEGRIAGAPSSFEYVKPKDGKDPEFKVAATLDDAARTRFGIELGQWLFGPVTLRVHGISGERETKMTVDADMTAAQVVELVPGWNKPAGQPARAQYRLTERDGALKFEDIVITSQAGVNLRGTLDLDADGNMSGANFTTFQLSGSDRATMRAERTADGALKVVVRGTSLDARGLLKSLSEATGGQHDNKKNRKPRDLDIDLRLASASGNNGETIRNLVLSVVRRNGEIRSFALLGKIGRDSSIVGELRAREGGRPVIYITAGDAGALFRFGDYYGKIRGGEIWIVLDTPTQDGAPQDGIVSVRNFQIVGEPNLDRLISSTPQDLGDRGPQGQRNQPTGGAVQFIRMRVDFTRTPGRFAIREGLIFGPAIGATVDGVLDYANNAVQLRGTYVPAYGLNNFFGQLPVVGLFLGGPKEGLLALTFEIAGPASRPILRVNPMSMAAPGFFRKIFEFRGMQDAPPTTPLQ